MYSYQPCMHITKQLLIRCILIARIVNKKNNLINYINFSLKWDVFDCLQWSTRSIVIRRWSWTAWTTCCPLTVCWVSGTRPQNSQTWRSQSSTSLTGHSPSRPWLSSCPTFWWCLWITTTSLMVNQFYASPR